MKNPIVRILIRAILFSLILGVAITIIGLLRGWRTGTQFSDGFFWAGAILISIGFLNLRGALSQRTVSGLQNSQSAVHLDMAERFRIWEADAARGYNLLAFLGASGVLLLGLAGLAILLGRLFSQMP
jgi:hypothetical protein